MLSRRQARDLLAWTREGGCLIEPPAYLGLVEDSGQEHRVWLDERRQRYFKVTFPGRFGFGVMALPSGGPELVWATPLEYLDRDAHPANFVQDTEGVILPIDLILVHAEAALQEALRVFLV